MMTTHEIATRLNDSGYTYYGEIAKAWVKYDKERIYFGSDFVSIINGVPTNIHPNKARALSIGNSALEAVEKVMGL